MKTIFQVAAFLIVLATLQGCANSSSSVPAAATSSMSGGAPNTDYIYRSPSYQISHGRF